MVFHVRTATMQVTLALVCTVPFWTSNIIRMIFWVPFLGRNWLANSALIDLGVAVMGGALRKKLAGAGVLFHLAVAGLVIPSILVSLGVGLFFSRLCRHDRSCGDT